MIDERSSGSRGGGAGGGVGNDRQPADGRGRSTARQQGAYPPLSEYGVVGDTETCALVSRYGSIDWLPVPDLESPSVFAGVLDADRGGHFSIRPGKPFQSAQTYLDKTNVLRTDFYAASGRASLTDWMPFSRATGDEQAADGGKQTEVDGDGGVGSTPNVRSSGDSDPTTATPGERSATLFRRVACEDGSMELSVDFEPRPDYARVRPTVEATDRGVAVRGDGADLFLSSSVPLTATDAGASAGFALREGEAAWFGLGYDCNPRMDPDRLRERQDETVEAWRRWVHKCDHPSRCVYGGEWHHLLERSELVLKLLTHRETGAIAAAPTTSLPEAIGGTRNWDYRFTWIRDAALTVQALYKLGHVREAKSYFDWLLTHVYEGPESIQPLYGLHGEREIEERTLDHLRGYEGSAPVRVGNAAHDQRQLDVFGELVLALYETSRYGEAITEDNWEALREIVDHVESVWDEPDAGIWEVRTEPRHFVHSKVMCWTALDRGIKIVEGTDYEGPVGHWRDARDDLRSEILERGYSEERGSFVRAFDTETELDATALLVPVVGFLPFDDRRVRNTVAAVRESLTTEDGLVYRYHGADGLPGGEGTFVLCSFWLVNALALSDRADEAEALFESVLNYASPLGLFAEEIAAGSGRLLGNYPQAFSHIGLVNSALYLDRATRNQQSGPEPLGTEEETGEEVTTE